MAAGLIADRVRMTPESVAEVKHTGDDEEADDKVCTGYDEDDAKWRMARLATEINRDVENIGARRLHTIIERLMEDLSFSATDRAGDKA